MKILNRGSIKFCYEFIQTSKQTLQLLPVRFYGNRTMFSDYYQNPIFRKEDQMKLIENNELSKMAVTSFKPPGPHETSSVYYDPLVSKVIRHIMKDGRKDLARSLIEKAFENVKRIQIERYHLASHENKSKIILNPKDILYHAIENSKPLLHLQPVKRGGIAYQVPSPITEKRSLFTAIKWLLEAAKERERTIHFPEQFARVLLDAANNVGEVVKRKRDLHRQCEANRAYAHYRWQR